MSRARSTDPFADIFGEFGDRLRGDRWLPDVDIFETDEGVVVRVELAGVRREDLRVTVDGRTLKISGITRPVIQVVNASADETVYTVRIRGNEFRPKVFETGSYVVKVADPDAGEEKILRSLEAELDNDRVVRVAF